MAFVIFQEIELCSLNIRIIQKGTFQTQKIKTMTMKKFLIFREMELSSLKLKKILIYSGENLQSLESKYLSCFLKKFSFTYVDDC